MELRKRKQKNINYPNGQTKKFKIHRTMKIEIFKLINLSVTHFEDLSNELVYEIFDHLDVYHIYDAFFHLNRRFEHLLIHSNSSMKFDISAMPKSKFEEFYSSMIQPNQHRITSLRLSDLLIVNQILSPAGVISEFLRLETLILDQIESKQLENVLQYAVSLPNLSTLTINGLDYVDDSSNIYYQIFRLPRLKYCQLSGLTMGYPELIPNVNSQHSPIEYLVMKNSIYYDHFDILLSYVPQLRYFSIRYLDGCFTKRAELSGVALSSLAHLSMDLHMIEFTRFEKIIQDCFNQLKVLKISTARDVTYLHANRWEILIKSHLQNLQLFEMDYTGSRYCDELSSDVFTNNFNSLFWIERKTICIRENDRHGNIDMKVFFSIDPSRKIHCRSFEINDAHTDLFQSRININSIEHVNIASRKSMMNCKNVFSNVTTLTLGHHFDAPYLSFTTDLIRIIPLVQLKTLIIDTYDIRLRQMLEILRLATNVQKLEYCWIPPSDVDRQSIQATEAFIDVVNNNRIKTLDLRARLGLSAATFILTLFPRLENLKICVNRKEVNLFIKFLLTDQTRLGSQLFQICLSGIPKVCMREVKRLIKSEKLMKNYLIEYYYKDLYLCW